MVFEGLEDLAARIDDPDLDVTPDDLLVLKNAGPHARRHAGGRLPADPEQAGAGRRQGHGAHLRRAHERHRLRHDRAARRAGSRGRRPAGRGAQRRPHPRCRSSDKRIDLLVDEAEIAPASGRGPAAGGARARLRGALSAAACCRRRRAATSTSSRGGSERYYAATTPRLRLARIMPPTAPKPRSIIAQVAGSGTPGINENPLAFAHTVLVLRTSPVAFFTSIVNR